MHEGRTQWAAFRRSRVLNHVTPVNAAVGASYIHSGTILPQPLLPFKVVRDDLVHLVRYTARWPGSTFCLGLKFDLDAGCKFQSRGSRRDQTKKALDLRLRGSTAPLSALNGACC